MRIRLISFAIFLLFTVFGLSGIAVETADAGRNYGGAAAKHQDYLYPPSYDECVKTGKPVITRQNIYRDGWIDLNKNGRKDLYEDPARPVETRIDDLLSQMTLEEKTCQLVTLYGYNRVCAEYLPAPSWKKALWKDGRAGHLRAFCSPLRFRRSSRTKRCLWIAIRISRSSWK